jgi:hypothetical protein
MEIYLFFMCKISDTGADKGGILVLEDEHSHSDVRESRHPSVLFSNGHGEYILTCIFIVIYSKQIPHDDVPH